MENHPASSDTPVYRATRAETIGAKIISWLFHPLLMPTYSVLFYYFSFTHIRMTVQIGRVGFICGMILMLTFLTPGVSTFFLVRRGSLGKMELPERQERLFPIVYTTIIYFVALMVIRGKGLPVFIEVFLLGSVVALLFAALMNFITKISLHGLGIGGLAGGMLAAFLFIPNGNLWLVIAVFLLCGIVGTARLILQAHRPAEIYTGLVSGFCIEFAAIFFLGFRN